MPSRLEMIDELLQACGKGELDEVNRILDSGVSPSSANRIGYTPLMSAASSYRVEVLKVLLARGADPNSRTSDGLSALHCAVGSTPSQPGRQAECVKILLSSGCSPNVYTDTGLTPLMNAAWFGCHDAVKLLLANKADTSVKDNMGRTARDLALAKKRTEILRLLDGE